MRPAVHRDRRQYPAQDQILPDPACGQLIAYIPFKRFELSWSIVRSPGALLFARGKRLVQHGTCCK